MPRRRQPPKLWLRPARFSRGKIRLPATWIILDCGIQIATGCTEKKDQQAQSALAGYIAAKYKRSQKLSSIDSITIADVLSIYDDATRERQANKRKFDERLQRLNEFWGDKALSEVNGEACRLQIVAQGCPREGRCRWMCLRASVSKGGTRNAAAGAR